MALNITKDSTMITGEDTEMEDPRLLVKSCMMYKIGKVCIYVATKYENWK